MKRIVALLFVALAITAGCRAQQITPNPIATAPPVTSSAFSQVTATPGIAVTTYTDLPATGSFCYFVQMLDGAAGVSQASNVVCATTTGALKHVSLSWSFPSGYACQATCTYMVSRAAAVLTPVGVPALSPATNTAELEAPGPELADGRLHVTLRLR